MSQNKKLGYGCAIGAQVVWGLFPIYVHQLKEYDTYGIVAHRAIWSFLFLIGLVFVSKFIRSPNLPSMSELTGALGNKKFLLGVVIAATLIAINWIGFVWAASNDHKLDASLGYYICPQVVVLLGVICLGERLSLIQWIAVALAGAGVGYMAIAKESGSSTSLPALSILIAFSFGFYGLAKKKTKLSALGGLTLETGFLIIPAAIFFAWQYGIFGIHSADSPGTKMFTDSWSVNLLLLGSGAVTILPLALYATAVKHLPLSTMGLLQFIGPTIQFFLGLFVYGEKFDQTRVVGFLVVWVGVGIYLLSLRQPISSGKPK